MASRRIADLLIKIGADSFEFSKATQSVEKGLGNLSKRLDKFGKDMSLKVTAPLAVFGAASVKAFDDSAKAAAKVQQAIKSTGGAAKLSFDQLNKFASGLQGKTIFEDDFILDNATAQLLTFTNIAGDNFKRTQTVALDLATVLNGDLKSASIQLGKALNDPVKNLSALSRSGIQFSKGQTAVIKNLAQTNRLAEAQVVILTELERQYGGQAEAAAKVGLGPLIQLKNLFGDFMEQIGQAMMPAVNKIVALLSRVVASLQSMSPEMIEVTVIIGGIVAAIGPLAMAIGGIIRLIPMLNAGFATILSPVGLVVAAVLALGAAFLYAYMRKKELQTSMTDKFAELPTSTLKQNLSENKRLQAVNENESRWQGNSPIAKITYAINKGSRRDALKLEEQALTAAIEQRTKAIKEQQKAEEESARIAKNMAEILKAINSETTNAGGLINDLTAKINALEKKKLLPSSTEADIAAINSELIKLKEELSSIQNITPNQLKGNMFGPVLTGNLASIAPITPEIKIATPNFSTLINKTTEQMQLLRDSVKDGVYGWADSMSSTLQTTIIGTEQIVSQYTDALVAKGWSFNEALNFVVQNVGDLMTGLSEGLNNLIVGSIDAVATSIGGLITGDIGLDGLLASIGSQIANFMSSLGKQLVEFGVLMLGLQAALKSIGLNPWLAIGLGTAMIIAASVLTSSINKKANAGIPKLANGGLAFGPTYALVGDNRNANVDPEVVAPLSKLKSIIGSGQQNIHISGELRASGGDLAIVLDRNNVKLNLMRG